MLHEPASSDVKDLAAAYKSRIGVWMFFLYALFYAGFVAINLYDPLIMEITVVFGLNLATVYGFSLIIFALVLALIYNRMCGKKEKELNEQTEEGKS